MVEKNQNRKQIQKNKISSKENTNVKTKNKVVKTANKQVKNIKRKTADDKSARSKKNKSFSKIFSWTILTVIFIAILAFLLKSETFKICNIEITGTSQVSQETILLLSEIDLNDNIFLTNTIRAKNKISQNPYIKDVNIKRELPDKIIIEIIEKEKAFILQIDEMFAYVDKFGNILDISETKVENLILLKGFKTSKEKIAEGETLEEKDLEKLEDVHKILRSAEKEELNEKIFSINIKDKNNYILDFPTYKKIIYIGDTSNLSTKMLRAKDILDKTMDKEGKIFVNGEFSEGFDPYFREETNN